MYMHGLHVRKLKSISEGNISEKCERGQYYDNGTPTHN